MSESPHPLAESQTGDPPAKPPGRTRWQVSMRTLFLLVAAVAVWITCFINRQHNAALGKRIAVMRPMSRELVINDERQVAVVKLEELWIDDNRWEIYLPEGQYRLCLATREIEITQSGDGLAPVMTRKRLGAGRHSIALEQRRDSSGWHVTATCDGTGRLAVTEPLEWNPVSGSTGGSQYSVSTQVPADQPVVLYRRIFHRRSGGKGPSTPLLGPTEGVMIWIERVAGPKIQP